MSFPAIPGTVLRIPFFDQDSGGILTEDHPVIGWLQVEDDDGRAIARPLLAFVPEDVNRYSGIVVQSAAARVFVVTPGAGRSFDSMADWSEWATQGIRADAEAAGIDLPSRHEPDYSGEDTDFAALGAKLNAPDDAEAELERARAAANAKLEGPTTLAALNKASTPGRRFMEATPGNSRRLKTEIAEDDALRASAEMKGITIRTLNKMAAEVADIDALTVYVSTGKKPGEPVQVKAVPTSAPATDFDDLLG